jgi:hypothetical protein
VAPVAPVGPSDPTDEIDRDVTKFVTWSGEDGLIKTIVPLLPELIGTLLISSPDLFEYTEYVPAGRETVKVNGSPPPLFDVSSSFVLSLKS